MYELSMKADSNATSEIKTFLVSGKNSISLHFPITNHTDHLVIEVENVEATLRETFHDEIKGAYYDNKNYIQLQGYDGIPELVPGVKAKVWQNRGICKYFTFSKKPSSFASVATNSELRSGVLHLYVKKGASEFASESNYDYHAHSEISTLLPIEPSTNLKALDLEEYSVAVCSKAWAIFSILLTVDNAVPYAVLSDGEILKREIRANSSFAVHYVASHANNFTINVDGEVSGITVYQANYNSFADMTNMSARMPAIEAKTQILKTKSPGLPASIEIKSPATNFKTHYIFRIVPTSTDIVTFYIGSSSPSVQIGLRQNEELQEKLRKGESRSYVLQTGHLEAEMYLKVRVESGKIKVKTFNDQTTTIGKDGPETKKVKITPQQTNESVDFLMAKASVQIVAETDDCLYDIVFEEPTETYSRILPGARYTVNNNRSAKSIRYYYQLRDVTDLKSFKVFFLLESKDKKSKTELEIKDWLLNKAKFYFVTESGFSLDESDSLSKVLADVKKVSFSKVAKRQRLQLEFSAQPGYFLITFDDLGEANHYDLSFELSINNYFSLGTDSYVLDYCGETGFTGYQIYVPRKGQLYVDFEDCSGNVMAHGSVDYFDSRQVDSEKTKLTSTLAKSISFDEPGFYYVSITRRQGRLASKEKLIPFILRTEFTDSARSTWLSSYFSDTGSKGVLHSAKVDLILDRQNITATVRPSLRPSTTFDKDFPDFDKVEVQTILAVRSVTEEEKLRKMPCASLDHELISLVESESGDGNDTSADSVESVIRRNMLNDQEFNWTGLAQGHTVVADYPVLLSNSSNRNIAVTVIIIYRLAGKLIYDTYDDSSIAFGYTTYKLAPSKLEFPTGIEDGAPVPEEPKVLSEPPKSGKSILFYIVVVILSILVFVGLVMGVRALKNRAAGEQNLGFTRATRVSTAEEYQPSDATKQIEITANKRLDETDDTI